MIGNHFAAGAGLHGTSQHGRCLSGPVIAAHRPCDPPEKGEKRLSATEGVPPGKLRSKLTRCQRKLLPSASKTVHNASPLVLKLSRKERLSHIDDYNVVQAFFAQDHKNHLFCYANANLMSDEQATEVLRFAEYGKI